VTVDPHPLTRLQRQLVDAKAADAEQLAKRHEPLLGVQVQRDDGGILSHRWIVTAAGGGPTCVRSPGPLAAAAWVLGWDLDDDEREPVWVVDGHLDQTPGLVLGLGVYRNAPLGQALVGRADVADL